MSILFGAAADRLKISTSTLLWASGNPFTEMGYYRINATTGGLQTFQTVLLDNVTAYIFVGVLNSLVPYFENSSGANITGASALSLNTWYHIAFTYNPGGNAIFYLNGTSLGTTSAAALAGTPDQMERGGWRTTNGNRLSGDIAACKSWNRILSGAEITAEIGFAEPQSTTSLYGVWYLQNTSDTTDRSGNGHHWSVLGAPTNSTDPPGVVFPSSSSSKQTGNSPNGVLGGVLRGAI